MEALRGMRVLWTAALAGLPAAAPAQDLERGRALYEHHCRYCHEDWAHTRAGRKVTELDELRARVAAWSLHAGLSWGDEEIDAVTRYLDRRCYRLSR